MGQSRFQYKEVRCTRGARLAALNYHGNGGWNYCSEYVEIEAEMAEDTDSLVILMKLEIKPA